MSESTFCLIFLPLIIQLVLPLVSSTLSWVLNILGEQDHDITYKFSAANLALAGFPLTSALNENLPSRY